MNQGLLMSKVGTYDKIQRRLYLEMIKVKVKKTILIFFGGEKREANVAQF